MGEYLCNCFTSYRSKDIFRGIKFKKSVGAVSYRINRNKDRGTRLIMLKTIWSLSSVLLIADFLLWGFAVALKMFEMASPAQLVSKRLQVFPCKWNHLFK